MLVTIVAFNGKPTEMFPVTKAHSFNWKEYKMSAKLITKLRTEL